MNKKILVVAAHSDDEVLGCGGTLAKFAEIGFEISVIFMTDGVGSRLNQNKSTAESRKEHSLLAAKILGVSSITQHSFPDNGLDQLPLLKLVQKIEEKIEDFKPSIVFTHYSNDLNIDHRVVAQATLTATRPLEGTCVKKVVGFEVNSSTEWAYGSPSFTPNYFVDISSTFETKLTAMRAYKDELKNVPHPRSIEGISALASLRGNAVGVYYAEGFQIYRLVEG